MTDALLEIRSLDAGTAGDFLRLHDEANGLGWCRCVAWWVPTLSGFGDRTAVENLALHEDAMAAGDHEGLIAYRAGEPVGWCQVGPRDRLPGLRMFDRPADPSVWAVTCFAVAPDHRRLGVASALLDAAIVRAMDAGASAIEAVPRRDRPGESGEEWAGPLDMFLERGFAVVDESDGRRVVVRRESS